MFKKFKFNVKTIFGGKKFYAVNKKSKFHHLKRATLFFFIVNLIFFIIIYIWLHVNIIKKLPSVDNLSINSLKITSKIYDKDGNLIYKSFKDENRSIIRLDEIPESLKNALISMEDKEFYKHKGVSLKGIARAFYYNYFKEDISLQGGSTITQQLVKNTLLNQERTFDRKLKELFLSLKVEQKYTKDQILEMYLNTISFGSTAHGVEEASLMYFRKSAKEVNLAESTVLASLPAAPTTYSPYVNLEKLKARQKEVLRRMKEDFKITDTEEKNAINIINSGITYYPPINKISSPHFVNYVQDYLKETYGKTVYYEQGLKVFTTLDSDMQLWAQGIVKEEVEKVKKLDISNGSALITKNKTGEVLAMVGSIDYYDEKNDGYVNLAVSLRQGGSTIKPFNYLLFLQQENEKKNNGAESKKNTIATVLKDLPIRYEDGSKEGYRPTNYDKRFRGNVSVRKALANSLNVPSVAAMAVNKPEKFVDFIKDFGIKTFDKDKYGLAISLGSQEVRMVEMNPAFSTIANLGLYVKGNPVRYILTANGDVLTYNPCLYKKESFENKRILIDPGPCGEQIVDKNEAFLIKSVLTDFKARAESFGTNSILNVVGTGAKTGTTNDLKDNWTYMFNNEYTVGTWVGNNNNKSMNSRLVSGVTGAAPIAAKLVVKLTNKDNEIKIDTEKSEDVLQVNICPNSEFLACNSCGGLKEYFIKGTEPKFACKNEFFEKKEEKKKD